MRIAQLTRIAGAAAVGLSLTTAACLYLNHRAVDAERAAVSHRAELRQLSNDLAAASDFLTNEARRYTIFGKKEHFDNYWREVKDTKTRDRVVNRLKELGARKEELDLIEKAKANSDALIKTEEAAMEAVARGDLERARTLMFDDNYDRNKAVIMQPIAEFRTKLVQRSDAEMREAEAYGEKTATAAQVMVGLTLLSFVAVLYFVFHRRMVGPVSRLSAVVARLARQDYAVEVPETGRRDEIGAMAQAVQVFKDNMIEADRLRAEQETAKANAAQTQKAALEEMADRFERSVSGIVGAVASAATEMEGTAQSMSATAEEASRQASTVSAATTQAMANVQTVATAAEELSASIAEIGRQVAQSATIAREAVVQADTTNATVEGLANAAQKIGEVVSLIQTIAGQTNLLALNATIEAARAGEHGKGFAVVASEVKNLANQTAKATEEIATQIAAIQGATGEAVGAIQGIGTTIGRINEIAAAIASAVEEQGAATKEIAGNVQQAARGTEEVASNIVGVTQASGEVGAAATQVLGSASELSRQSERLKQEVDTFLGTVRAA